MTAKRAQARSKTAPVTASGRRLTADYEKQLVEEAEAGFEPEALTRRPVGRPSLSARRGHSHRVDVRLDDETYAAVRRAAEAGDVRVSDVVREAIARYLEAS